MPGPTGVDSGDSPSTSEPTVSGARDGLHVMSFNIRYHNRDCPPGDPDCWPDREPLLKAMLEDQRPHLLGTQEVLFHQLSALRAGLPDHDYVGYGRGGGSVQEHVPVFFDPERLELTAWDQRWLSDTPMLINSKTWGNTLPRVLVRCDFTDRLTGAEFTFINTHLDHESELARVNGARQIACLATEADRPVIVTGDMNATAESSQAWQVLTDAGLLDTWLSAEQRLSDATSTWHDYQQPTPQGNRIDWILASPAIRASSTKINNWTLGGRWPSDHLPVQAELVIG